MNAGPPNRSDAMHAVQKGRRAAVVAAVRGALLAMEREIGATGGSRGHGMKVCRAEACRRAGIGLSTLKNPSHVETRAFVDRELARLKKLAGGRRKPTTTEAPSPRIDANKVLAVQLDAAMRELDEVTGEVKRLTARNAELNAEIAGLRDTAQRKVAAQAGPGTLATAA